jgi:putative DNA primase/helicase
MDTGDPLAVIAALAASQNCGGPPTWNGLVTEDSAAQHFAELFQSKLRYCHTTGTWFEWTGQVWTRDRTGLAFQWARELARDLSRDELPRARYINSKTSFASGVERFARHDPTFAVTIDDWDRDPWLLGTPEGTVDLQTGLLRPGDPADGITRSTAVAPAGTASCPRFLQFLREATGGQAELIRFLQQVCGYSLTGVTREQSLVFIYGGGGEGKTTFVAAIAGVMGGYAAVAPMDTFIASRYDRHPTELAMLCGARLVTASENEEGRAWAEARIKQLTGGDPITARFMHKDFFTYTPNFKLLILGNHRPVLRNVDDAARRRFNIVPFTRKPANPDPDLGDKLKAEGPGILRWMIEGCLDWQNHGLVRPKSVINATEEYFSEQDLFGQWLEEKCEVDPSRNQWSETAATLFGSWREYAFAAGDSPGSKKSFAEALQRRGVSPDRNKRARIYRGITLRG